MAAEVALVAFDRERSASDREVAVVKAELLDREIALEAAPGQPGADDYLVRFSAVSPGPVRNSSIDRDREPDALARVIRASSV